MKFDRILRDAIEEDDGLILRLAAFEQMVGQRKKTRGWSARLFDVLMRRSRMIFGMQSAVDALTKRSTTCH